jgi:hypothetical protein
MSTPSPPEAVTHTAPLPLGYKAQFTWSAEGGFRVEWDPAPPSIRSPRHRKKFFQAYARARHSFLTDVAVVVGGAVGILDVPAGVTDGLFVLDCVRPPTRH